MTTGLSHPRPKTVRLLGEGSQLGHPLLGGNKLSGHLPAQPRLLDEAVPGFLLLTKEPRLPPARSDKGLKGNDGQNTKKYIEKEKGEKQGQANTRSA